MKKRRLTLKGHYPEFGNADIFNQFNYSPAVSAAGLTYVSGQVGIAPDGTIPDDPFEQIELAFKRLGFILSAENLSFDDLIDLTSYHVNIGQQLSGFCEIKDKYIKREFPAWTSIGVESLARPNFYIEIKAVAANHTQ